MNIREVIKSVVPARAIDVYRKVKDKQAERRGGVPKFYSGSHYNDFGENVIRMKPLELLNKNRIDIVVRYFLFRDMIEGKKNNDVRSLYARTILYRTKACEPENYYAVISKRTMEEHFTVAQSLLDSLKKDGFDKKEFVPVGKNGGLLNGAHRIAASIALKDDIWVKYYQTDGMLNFGYDWFVKSGFSLEDRIRILRGYADLKENCGIVVLYAPIEKQWDYVEMQLGKNTDVIGSFELDFEDNYIAFENLLHDIYNSYSKDAESPINRKIELLKLQRLSIRVILTEGKDTDINATLKDFKWKMRDLLHFDVEKVSYLSLHATDGINEFTQMKMVLLSNNNLSSVKHRLKLDYRKTFFERLDEYKELCKKYEIPLEDTCIVSSTVLEAFGIREAGDFDFVVSNRHFDRLSKKEECKNHRINYHDLDLLVYNYMEITEKTYILNDSWIYDENEYFVLAGCKFINLQSVYKKKKPGKEEKNIKDCRLIELYQNYSKYCDDRAQFEKRVKEEMRLHRRR